MATIILKPSEYQGAAGTAVAGRIVIFALQEVESRARERAAAAPSRGKGGRGAKGKTDATSTTKLEMHISGTDSTAEVLYVEAWAEMATQLYAKFKQGDLITIAGGTVISAAQPYSTSKLLYYLRLKGTLGIQVQIAKVDTVPWTAPGLLHPLVPLRSLERVRDRQQICVAAVMVENPGSVERQTSNGMASVCNAIVQEGDIRVRCGFWREHAEKLAAVVQNTCIVLYQVLVSKRKQDQDSWELGSWRGTQIMSCPQDHADRLFPDMTFFRFLYVFLFFYLFFIFVVSLKFCQWSSVLPICFFRLSPVLPLRLAALHEKENCRMLTDIPIKDWKNCPAVPASLSGLFGVIVPGMVRKVDTVFEVVGLQAMGINSVRSETDEWLLVSCSTCKRAAPCQAPWLTRT